MVRTVPWLILLLFTSIPAAAQIVADASKAGSDRVVTATRISSPIVIDGQFDEEIYRTARPAGDFIQQEPREGAPSSEATELWVLFDDDTLYIAGKCYDAHPENLISTEMRRDNTGVFNNDSIAVVLDTFHDLRTGFRFQTNALGSITDGLVADEVNNDSWNTVWDTRSAVHEWGWGFEMAIPFKSLRYPSTGAQTWGINMRRVIKHKNEHTYLTALPRSFGINALHHLGSAATLVGLETPRQSMNLEFKPYAVATLLTDRAARVPSANEGQGDAGFDFKYGLTRSLMLDATFRTDFAQVEEDQQQVNLTRYSLFFPEKREFFLEGQSIFAFGGAPVGNNANPGDIPVMFFSRQIGLSGGQPVPVIGGVRLTGRMGRFQIGAVNIQTGDKPEAGAVSTNFTALRIRRDVLRRSNIGIIATLRTPGTVGGSPAAFANASGESYTYGTDANLFLFANVLAHVYYARTDSSGVSDAGQDSYRGRFEFVGDRWGYAAEHLLIGDRFNPEVGFVRRRDFRRNFGQVRFSPRPRNNRRVRQYSYTASVDYITDAAVTRVQEKELSAIFNTAYQNGDSWNAEYTNSYELLPASFVITPGTTVPGGGYTAQNVRTQYTLGQQRKVSGRIFAAYGTLYDGRKTEAGYTGRLAIVPQFAIEPSLSLNWVRLPYGNFSAPVVTTRFIFTPTPRTMVTSFIQYNGGSRQMGSSVRLRWEYRPASELFVVYSDGRSTLTSGYPDLVNRSVALKITRLLRF